MPITKKIVIVGSYGVGKTSLMKRFVHQIFSDEYLTTLGVKIDKKELLVDDTNINLIIWDVAGEDQMEKIPTSYYLGSNGFIYLFDLTRSSTVINLKQEIEYLQTFMPDCPFVIVGNKVDLVDESYLKDIREATTLPIEYFTSAKNGENVEELFLALAKKIINQ